MYGFLRRRWNGAEGALSVDIAPLIDVVFILLVFLLLSAAFLPETGIEVRRPEAVHATPLEAESLRVAVAAGGAVHWEGREVSLEELSAAVRRFLDRHPDGVLVVVADESLPSGRLVEVMDAGRAGGAREIAVAARQARRP